MATRPSSMEKPMYETPMGLGQLAANSPELDVDVVDDATETGMDSDGSMVVDLSEGKASGKKTFPEDTEFGENLAETLDDDVLLRITSDLDFQIDKDRMSRRDWEDTYKEGLTLLGLKIEQRKQPWDGACGIVHPMITEAVVRFQAELTTETFPAQGPVRTKIIGLENRKKKESAARVEADMNYELTENMPEFRPEHERLLWELPCVGAAFKKVYYDESLGRQTSMFVSAEDILLPYGTTEISSCYRVTHVIRRTKDQVLRLMESGFYREYPMDDAPLVSDDLKSAKDAETGQSDINDDRHILHESHVDLYIPEDPKHPHGKKSACPYVVTYIKDASHRVLALRRNWEEDDKKYIKRQHFVQYNYVPGFGSYGYGLFHLIGGYAKGATSILRQLVDAGTLSNLPGGLKARGLRIKGDDTPIAPGEFRDVDIGSGTIKDNILPLPYKEPSLVLANTLDKIIEDARRFASTADMQVGDMSSQAPVGTTLALLERQLKTLTAVQARVHFSLKQELKLLKRIISDYTPTSYKYDPATGVKSAKRADYEVVDVIPVSDPNASTLSQRVIQGQTALQMASMAPEVYDMAVLHRRMLETLGFKDADKIVPLPDDMKPMDPVSENMNLLKSKPVKAFMWQDHMSHIAVHQAAMQDPLVQQVMGQNPKAPMIMAAAAAHLAEHIGYQHRQQIEARLGITLPPEGESMPPQVETALSSMMAQAAQQVLSQNQAMAAVQAQQAQSQDPLVQLQLAELEVKKADSATKKADSETKSKKVLLDAAARSDELDIERTKVEQSGMQVMSKVHSDHAKVVGDTYAKGMQLGLDTKGMQSEIENSKRDQQHQHSMEQADQQFQHSMQTRQQDHAETTGAQDFGLRDQQFQADTAHKAHQAVMTDGKQRRDESFQQEQAATNNKMAEKKMAFDAKKAKPAAAKKPTPKK